MNELLGKNDSMMHSEKNWRLCFAEGLHIDIVILFDNFSFSSVNTYIENS